MVSLYYEYLATIKKNKLQHISKQFSVPFCKCFHLVAFFSVEIIKYKSIS